MTTDIPEKRLPLDLEAARRVRRLAGRVMNVLDYDPVWTNPRGKLDVFASVEHLISDLVRRGESDDRLLLEQVLAQASQQTMGPRAKPFEATPR